MFFGFIIIKLTRREATSLNLYKILKSSLIGLVFLPAILYFFYPYINFSHKEDFSRPLDEVQYYSARPLDFFLTSPDNITFGKLSKSLENIHYSGKEPPYSYGEHVLFPGLIASILLLLIVLNKHSRQILKKNLEVKVSFIAYLLSVIFAFGPYLKIGSVVIKLPYFYLYQYFPLLEAIRTPTRIIYVSLFFVSLLCAFEIMILKDFWRTRKNYLLLGVLALIIVEYLTYFPFQTINYVPLKFDLGGKNVLFLPIRKDIRSNNINGTKYLIQHLNNDFVSINGHTGSEPSIEGYDYLIDTLKNTEFSDRWFNVLRTLNVTYVVIDKRFLNDVRFLDQPISTNLQKFEKYTVYSDQTWSVIDITNINETNIASCKDSEPSRLQYVFDAKYSKGDNALTIYYDIKNNQNCHSSFIYDNRYFRINYTLNSKFNKHMYIKLPPYLLSGDTYGGSIQIPGKFKFKPELIAIDLGFSTMVLTIEDQPM